MNIEHRTQRESIVKPFSGLFCFFFLAASSVFGQDTTNALPKLVPPHGTLPPTFWEQNGTATAAGGVIFLALAAVLVWRNLKSRPQWVLPPDVVAREALAKCRGQPEDGKVLSEVSRALRRYIGAALKFPPGEFTTAEFCRELEHREQITPQLKRAIADFLLACDERKFSPAVSSGPLDAAGRALEFVDLTEKESCRQDDACAAKNERSV